MNSTRLLSKIHSVFLLLFFISNVMAAMDHKKILAASVDRIIEEKSVLVGKKEASALLDCLVEVTGRPYSLGNLGLIRLSLKSLKAQLKQDIKKTQDEDLLDFFDDVCKAYRYATDACEYLNQAENQSSYQVKNDEKQSVAPTPVPSPRALSESPLRKSFTPRKASPRRVNAELNEDSIDKKVAVAHDDGSQVHG